MQEEQEPLLHEGKEVDIEKTIETMALDKPKSTDVNWEKLRKEIETNPQFLIQAAKACRTRIIYKEQ